MSKTARKIKYPITYAGVLAGFFLAFFVVFAQSAEAAPDSTIYYQGKLTDQNDVAVGGTSYDFKFRIYDASSGGNCLWSARGTCGTPTSKEVAVAKGIFSTELGGSGDNALSLDFNSNYWLEVTVGVDPVYDSPMDVRKKINAASYALNSLKLNGQDSSYYAADTGTDQNAFVVGNTTDSSTANTTLQFGNTNSETLVFDGASTDNFLLSDDLIVNGDITAQGGEIYITGITSSASTTEGTVYYDNDDDNLYVYAGGGWVDLTAQGGAGPWTDGVGISYLTDTAEDFAVGANTLIAPFSVDVENNTVRVGDEGTTDGKINMYASNGDTGSITYNTDDTWAFEGGRVAIGASMISDAASTERMLQVGSETNRGNLATYGEVISKGLNKHTVLTGIKDIFVYDTTGDSDGGRWIDWATTDNLSWYSEALDDGPNDPCNIVTDDRCYNSAFPRKAILVVTTDALYIFDAATNDMWMKFSQNSSGYALGVDTSNDPSSVAALNGVIYVGTNGSSSAGVNGLYAIDFVNDRMWFYGGTNRSAANTGISGRNATVTYNVDPDAKLDISPVGTAAEWERVNDVHAVVMSRTQSAVTALGGATNTNPGYGKVFVALATDSGVTVINLSGLVLNQYSDVAGDDYTAVALSSRGFLYALNTTQDQLERWDTIDTDKASEVGGTYSRKWDESIGTGPALASAAFDMIAGAPDNLEVAERASNNLNTEDVIYVGHSLGMAELHDHTTQAFGWVKYYNASRQTPMMILAGINDMVLPMDDTSGTQAQDIAIANTDMAIKGTPTLGVSGVQGSAINFDNTDDYLCSDANQDNACDVDTAFNMSTVGWTISLWFKHSTTAPASGADTIFEKCVTATPAKATGCVIAYMTTTGTIVVANDDDATYTRPDEGAASYDITSTSTYAYNDNQWHQLVITRTNANDVDSWIDGQGMSLSTATGNTLTFDGSQIVTLGASCSFTAGAACATTTNFWDGQIDDVQYVVGTTTQATMTQLYVRRLFNVERPRASKKTISVTDATSATATSLTDTGESWYANELAGLIVEITGSDDTDCVGITRRISSNTATLLTFTPAVPETCTLDTSTDFQVDPEALYGAANSVAGIGITAETPLGEARQLCVGTNNTADEGGVTCYNHQDGPSIVADVYHSQASQTDDSGSDWTGTNYDDMRAIDLSTRTLVMASEAHFTSTTEDVRLGQGLDYVSNQLYAIRQEIVLDGITAIGSTGSEVGFTGGADLAEYYKSPEPLETGMIVAMGDGESDTVKKTTSPYQKNVLGIVATAPGIILGTQEENSYPIALSGRVPVNMTTENGMIAKGDQVTSSSLSGYGMVAIETGRVIGTVLEDIDQSQWPECPAESRLPVGVKCGQVMVFVNLTNFTGMTIADLMTKKGYDTATQNPEFADLLAFKIKQDVAGENLDESAVIKSEWTNIFQAANTLGFLKKLNDPAQGTVLNSEILAKNVNASGSVVSPLIVTDTLIAKNIKAETIEGLEIFETGIQNAQTAADSNTTQVKSLSQQIADMQGAFKSLNEKSGGLEAGAVKDFESAGSLTVGSSATFNGPAIFKSVAEFINRTIFRSSVEFAGKVMFNQDTAGYALVKNGQNKVIVNFEKEYVAPPVVNASLSLQQIKDEEVRKAAEELLLVSDVKFIITNVTEKGFEIRIDQVALSDIPFSWQALAIKDAKIFMSQDAEKKADSLPNKMGAPDESAENDPAEVAPSAIPAVSESQAQNIDDGSIVPGSVAAVPVADGIN